MKKMVAVTMIAVAACTTGYPDAVSVSWKEFSGGVNDVLDGYGVVPANNWLNLQKSITQTNMILSSGLPSTRAGLAKLTTTVPAVTFTLSDLNGTFVSTYDVIVYAAGFNAAAGGNQGAISVGTTTNYYSVPNPYTTSLIESTDTDISDGADLGTYVRFNGLSGDSVTITLDAINGGVGIGGVQIVGDVIPEPATLGLLAVSGAAALFIRRCKRS
jgi:hypothetical protein